MTCRPDYHSSHTDFCLSANRFGDFECICPKRKELPILIDTDDVLSDFLGQLCTLAGRYGLYRTKETLQPGWKLANAFEWPEIDEAITSAIYNEALTYRMPELPGAIEWLRDVEATFGKERVYICTSPWNGEWSGQRHEWLTERGVDKDRIIQCKAKHLIPGLLVDDAEHHVQARPAGTGFLFNSPQNKAARNKFPHGDHAAAMQWLKEHA